MHEKTEYHTFSKQQAENFKINFVNPNKAIDIILIDNVNQQQEATNRKILSSIIKCILFISE